MTDYLLDTNHCVYLINGLDKDASKRSEFERKVIEKARNLEASLFMSEATLGEMYFGAANSSREKYNLQRIELFKEAVIPIPVNDDIWQSFGRTKAALRKQGISISDIDLLIACTAMVFNLVLVTNDADFDLLPADFIKENWA